MRIERLRGTDKHLFSGSAEDITGKSVFMNKGGNMSCLRTVHVSHSKLLYKFWYELPGSAPIKHYGAAKARQK